MAVETKELYPVNVTDQQREEFFRVYRILSSDILELENFVTKKEGFLEDAYSDAKMFESVESLIESVDNDPDFEINSALVSGVSEFKNVLEKQIDYANDFIANAQKELQEYSERLKRSQSFMDSFKEGIVFINDEGHCELSDEVLLLVEYLHSLGNILEPEEREKLLRQQQQG